MRFKHLALAMAAAFCVSAQAADSINLGNYSVSGIYSLDILGGTGGGISGLEASAVTYARDRGSLFFVGDEGTGVVEISLTGQTLGTMAFNWAGTGSTKHDTESLAYLGNGVLVVGEERLQDLYKFSYSNGGTAALANSFVSLSNATVGNSGMEGVSYDPRNGGSFISVKQENPENIMTNSVSFAAATGGLPGTLKGDGQSPTGGGTATSSVLFDASLMGLSTLSDVATLAPVDSFAGTPAADNLLVLSLGSRKLIEVTRQGVIKSTFDLSNVLPDNGIEGVTVDEKGNIYLVAEQYQPATGVDLTAQSKLIVLTAAVPEPETYAMLLMGLGVLPWVARRKKRAAKTA